MPKDPEPKVKTAKNLLRSKGVKYKADGNSYIFYVPEHLADMIYEQFNFSFDMLRVSKELPLVELAQHMNDQAGMEAYASHLAEVQRYQLSVLETAYDIWYNQKYQIAMEKLKRSGMSTTEKSIKAHIIYKYEKVYKRKKAAINEAEFKYRLLCNVVHAAIVTKGKMLQSLRNIIQGDGIGIGGIEVEVTSKRKGKSKDKTQRIKV